ncbi:Sbal_3080 family lipoprotein [Enterovibrio norvegicus]|uniref:Sbal_3080 family lipoprotein n=1 Tax=Enterovibrio norvegicus TaxID=188144 RepID=UPI003550E5CF
MKKSLAIIFAGFVLAGCSGPKFTVMPIATDMQQDEVTIVEHQRTRAVFLDNMLHWCRDSGKQCKVVRDAPLQEDTSLTLNYISRWSWDLRTYIADAKITAFKKSEKVGEVTFLAPYSANLDKFGNDNKRIQAMMALLFGELTEKEAQRKIADGEI